MTKKFTLSKKTNTMFYYPKSLNDLRQILVDKYKEQGPGTEQKPIDLNDIDLHDIDTFYDESLIQGIFEGMEFEYIDISNWDVSNVKSMQYMFLDCNKLKSIGDISNWDVSGVKSMFAMFDKCEQLTSIGDLSGWIVTNVEDISRMFFRCYKLHSVGDISEWNIESLLGWKTMEDAFAYSGIKNTPKWYYK